MIEEKANRHEKRSELLDSTGKNCVTLCEPAQKSVRTRNRFTYRSEPDHSLVEANRPNYWAEMTTAQWSHPPVRIDFRFGPMKFVRQTASGTVVLAVPVFGPPEGKVL